MGKAANHSSGHAGVEQSNELMGNGHSSKLISTTDFDFFSPCPISSHLSYDLANQVTVAAGQTSVEAERNNDALLFSLRG